MAYIQQQQTNVGLFIPTTTVYDQINSANISDEMKQILVVLYQNVNTIALSLNAKESGIYDLTEFVNGQGWFNITMAVNNQPRQDFRTVYYRTAVGAVDTFNHNINGANPLTSAYTFTRIYGVANDTVGFNYYPIPFASAGGAANIEIKVNATQVVITNNTGVVFDKVYIVLEYLKQ